MATDLKEQGTALAGYEEAGPYRCGACVHRPNPKSDVCIHPVVVADPAMKDRLVQIGDGKQGAKIDLVKGCCAYVQAAKKPIMLLARHGETALNQEGAFRSWINVPLDENGVSQAEAMAEFLKDCPIRSIFCSPLDRAFYTASLVGEKHGLHPMKNEALLPWNLGELSGKPKKQYMKVLQQYIDNPDEMVPGGESLNDFKGRMFREFDILTETADPDNLLLIVAHTSTITALQQWIDEDYAGSPEDDETTGPGGVVELKSDADKDDFEVEVIFGESKKAEFGS